MAQRTCSIEGCDFAARTRGWCSKHYQRWWATGDPLALPSGGRVARCCSIKGCERAYYGRGFCNMHWLRWRRHGDPGAALHVSARSSDCAVADCSRPHYGHSYCFLHWRRWRKHGDPLTVIPRVGRMGSAIERFDARTNRNGPIPEYRPELGACWIWTARLNPGGYGAFAYVGGQLAHRFAYEHFVGPIPDGLVLDHLCRVHACVNPLHAEPVTLAENTRRGAEARRLAIVIGGAVRLRECVAERVAS